jgi:aldehyde dehydrogenase (NAD+)
MKDSMKLSPTHDALIAFHDMGMTLPNEGSLPSRSPITGEIMGSVPETPLRDVNDMIYRSDLLFPAWRDTPAPQRGLLVRAFGEAVRKNKEFLGKLITLETGKILQEGLGEVQEIIDICEFAVGLSRQLYGKTIASERPLHHMRETWHPMGTIGIITAFNFPMAVFAWNACVALVCGNTVVWKPSEKTPLCAVALQTLFEKTAQAEGYNRNLSQVVHGGADVGKALVQHYRTVMVSATGSTRMGKGVAQLAAQNLKRTLLELGGNNAAIICPSADLNLTLRGVAFAAIGTAGQRCTTLRRLFVHRSIYESVISRLKEFYAKVRIGDPRDPVHIGPLVDEIAYVGMINALGAVQNETQGGIKIHGGVRFETDHPEAYYVRPALVEIPNQTQTVCRETFAPILYVIPYEDLTAAIQMNNEVRQGLSSSIFTTDIREAELFLSHAGSDCGITNVNIGPSGAEIGGAFGGEKETGGGRESGSDAWRSYMRRATNTVNYGRDLPLAQGVQFD